MQVSMNMMNRKKHFLKKLKQKINAKYEEKRKKHFLKNYQSQVSILGPVGYGPTTLPLRHSDLLFDFSLDNI